MADEGELDPWVAEWMRTNPMADALDLELTPELLELARADVDMGGDQRPIAKVHDDEIAGRRVRIYEHDEAPTGVVVYLHGGGYCIGSIGLMDNVARELAWCSGAAVVSVDYRLAPEHPFPAGLDDCESVVRAVLADTTRFATGAIRVAVAGESAGGNLSATVSLRLQGDGPHPLAAQVLIYPGTDGRSRTYPSQEEFDGLVLSRKGMDAFWAAYSGDGFIDDDPYAAPLQATEDQLRGLPPAFVVLGGCDLLRDEGRAYAGRLRDAGVPTEELCVAGQPHGFVNFGFPAAAGVFERVGPWLRSRLAS